MSFGGNIVKSFKKAGKGLKKIQKGILKTAKPIRPKLKKAGLLGQIAEGVLGASEVVIGEKERRKKGKPNLAIASVLRKTAPKLFAPLVRQAAAVRPTVISSQVISPQRVTLPSVRPPVMIPRPRKAAVVPTPMRRMQPMALQRVSDVRQAQVQPAGLRFQIPQALRDPIGTVARNLPLTFGQAPTAVGPAAPMQLVPLSPAADKFGRPLIVAPSQEARIRCPPGYLAVTLPDGSRACALAGPAISAGLAKRRRKPLISVKETRALALADRVRGKIKKVGQSAGFAVTEKRRVVRRKK